LAPKADGTLIACSVKIVKNCRLHSDLTCAFNAAMAVKMTDPNAPELYLVDEAIDNINK
jgi:hypothetical protein